MFAGIVVLPQQPGEILGSEWAYGGACYNGVALAGCQFRRGYSLNPKYPRAGRLRNREATEEQKQPPYIPVDSDGQIPFGDA